jgi:predicted nucleotide-binding protein (sugar kinase/HSP70/actin superfamily)
MIKVGIPRALLFYSYYRIWKTFFEQLGLETIISDETNKKILNDGITRTVDEVCLPVKVFNGHVASLKDRVDYLFIPRIMSVQKGQWICPKFQGLPEIVKYSFNDLPEVISPKIDFLKSRNKLNEIIINTGGLFTRDLEVINRAYLLATMEYNSYKTLIRNGLLPIDVIDKKFGLLKEQQERPKILLLGHPYILYDKFISMDTIKKLRDYGYTVVTEDSFDEKTLSDTVKRHNIDMYWTFGTKILGSALYSVEKGDIKGIVYLSSFSCGLDSVITEILEKKLKRQGDIPYTLITIDEHTGEAGVNTRLDAFVDMIGWRDRNESSLSAHG